EVRGRVSRVLRRTPGRDVPRYPRGLRLGRDAGPRPRRRFRSVTARLNPGNTPIPEPDRQAGELDQGRGHHRRVRAGRVGAGRGRGLAHHQDDRRRRMTRGSVEHAVLAELLAEIRALQTNSTAAWAAVKSGITNQVLSSGVVRLSTDGQVSENYTAPFG